MALAQSRIEENEGFVCKAEVTEEEVWENSACGVQWRRVRFVLRVPFIFELGERFGGVLGAEGKMSLSIVGLVA